MRGKPKIRVMTDAVREVIDEAVFGRWRIAPHGELPHSLLSYKGSEGFKENDHSEIGSTGSERDS